MFDGNMLAIEDIDRWIQPEGLGILLDRLCIEDHVIGIIYAQDATEVCRLATMLSNRYGLASYGTFGDFIQRVNRSEFIRDEFNPACCITLDNFSELWIGVYGENVLSDAKEVVRYWLFNDLLLENDGSGKAGRALWYNNDIQHPYQIQGFRTVRTGPVFHRYDGPSVTQSSFRRFSEIIAEDLDDSVGDCKELDDFLGSLNVNKE